MLELAERKGDALYQVTNKDFEIHLGTGENVRIDEFKRHASWQGNFNEALEMWQALGRVR